MAVTFETYEGVPASYPVVVMHDREEGSISEQFEVDAAVTWQRIEAWIRFRYAVRSVVYLVEGPGAWTSPLTPFSATTVEAWRADAWEATTPRPSPSGGYVFDGDGPYRVTGTAGDGLEPPAAVQEAWRLLQEYQRGLAASHMNETAIIAYDETTNIAAFAAKAIHLSGAADLLRPYRRLGA